MKNYLIIGLLLLSSSCNWASDIPVVVSGTSAYAIVTPVKTTTNEAKAAQALQAYILKSTGVSLLIVKENLWTGKPGFFIGKTTRSQEFKHTLPPGEGFLLASDDKNFIIYGSSGKGVLYGTYEFIERYLDGKKYADEPGKVAEFKELELPGNLHIEYTPPMVYRQTYYPQSNDPEYLDWHKLHKFEDLWGIWGHSYFKLVDPGLYFKTHPEYYALENGIRKPTQLCMSNEAVTAIAINTLRQKMATLPDAIYWSISPEDDLGYCQCDKCKAIHAEEGSPTGAHMRFVNNIAKVFPDKIFTTLAYTYTIKPPLKTKPLQNVYVMLSTIDAYRTQAIENEPSAAGFRKALLGWEQLTHNLFIWDYTTQFTNYLAPFPDISNLGPNIRYYAAHHVKGVFSQGSGDSYGEMAELKSYITAKLLWDPTLNEQDLMNSFCKDYYKAAGRYVQEYINLLQAESRKTNRQIDIYGNPVNEYNSYLTPELLDQYSTLFDQAEGAVEENEAVLKRIYRLRLSLDYVVLQQARFYGPERHGYLIQNEEDLTYMVNPKLPKRVDRFAETATKFKVTELSEGGLTPAQYKDEWKQIFDRGWKPNLATEATVTLKTPYAPEYPAKKERTLTDAVTGHKDFSYNWLCFYGNDMEVTIDMETTKEVSSISMNFLDDPRHWIFLPQQIEVTVSADGHNYVTATAAPGNPSLKTAMEEHYETMPVNFTYTVPPQRVRFVHVKVKNQTIVPDWRFRPNKKPMLACDEIFVN